MKPALSNNALDQLFREARSINVWTDTPVPETDVRAIYDLAKMGATSANCSPARFVFVTTDEGKAKLLPHVHDGNKPKVEAAPVTAIIAHDLDFADQLTTLFPHEPTAASWFSDPVVEADTAFRNGTLQAAYLMLAARALGYDCGPMSGFDNAGVDTTFFSGTRIKSNFICSIGVGSSERIFPRSPRLEFDAAAKIV